MALGRRPQIDLRASPGFSDWQQYARTLELRLRNYVAALNQYLATSADRDPVSVKHRVVVNLTAASRVVIDFREAQKYTLVLRESVGELVFIAPELEAERAASTQIEIIQAGAGTKTITTWTGLVFYAPDSAYFSAGVPVLSTAAGRVDVVAFSYNSWDDTLRGMYTRGATA